tara:strand:- start:214 stop:1083 length:870 start_codon:yes stop_codon:yes gene_type:complete
MFGLVLSPISSIMRGIEKIEKMKDRDSTVIDEYIKTVKIRSKSYKLRQNIKRFFRVLLIVSGFAITTMTTYNNPYFDGESDSGNIIVWYFSISNNIINLILEKIAAFDLDDDKNKIKLLINEGIKYNDNEDNYALYDDTYTMRKKKLEYFKNTCEMIYDMDSYSFLTRDYDRPVHKDRNINNRKLAKTEFLWKPPTPPENTKRNIEIVNIPNSVNLPSDDSKNKLDKILDNNDNELDKIFTEEEPIAEPETEAEPEPEPETSSGSEPSSEPGNKIKDTNTKNKKKPWVA